MTIPTRTRWRDAATIGAACLFAAAIFAMLWYRATYHVFPGQMPTVVHWCGRDYETGDGSWSWAQVTAAERPRHVRVVGTYPPMLGLGRPLLAAPVAGPVPPDEPCAMGVYVRTGPGRYRPYALEGGP